MDLLWLLWVPPTLYAIWSVWFLREVWRMDREQMEAGFPPGPMGGLLLSAHRAATAAAKALRMQETQRFWSATHGSINFGALDRHGRPTAEFLKWQEQAKREVSHGH